MENSIQFTPCESCDSINECYGWDKCIKQYNMEKENKGAGFVRVPSPKHQLPNGINLHRLAKLLSYSDRYQINIQFWPKEIVVYIMKDMVELKDFGGDFDFAIEKSIEYLDRINQVKQ